jgi:hypothetical protein
MTKALVVSAVLTTSVFAGSHALAETSRACTGWQYRVEHSTPLTTRERRMKKLIACVFREAGIGEEGDYAKVIADRESGLEPWALNSSSGAAGLFQHIQSYWPGRAHALPRPQFPRWPESSVFNARANAWAAARMVKASGWGAWTTA